MFRQPEESKLYAYKRKIPNMNKLILVLEKNIYSHQPIWIGSTVLKNSIQTRKIKGNTISKCVTNLHLKLDVNTIFKPRAALIV